MRHRHALSLQQASEESPQLANLFARVHNSQARLAAIQPLLPAALRAGVRAGPVEDGNWCILADNNAVAAKMRQLTPALLDALDRRGLGLQGIRIKVLGRA